MSRWIHWGAAGIMGAVALGVTGPRPVAAQSLHLAELFAEQGRVADAQAEIAAWFEISGDEATSEQVQHGLWLRGRLADNETEATADLQRLADQYPEGPYTGLALEWLAVAAGERGDSSRATELYVRVVHDTPDSEAAPRARAWLEEHGLMVAEAAPDSTPVPVPVPTPGSRIAARADSAVATPVDTAVAPPPDPVPSDSVPPDPVLPDRASVDTVAVPRRDSVLAEPVVADSVQPAPPTPADTANATVVPPAAENELPPPGPPAPGAPDGGAFAVQIGAFRNPAGASGLVDELVARGFDARLIQLRGSSLFRVRIGRYGTIDEARESLARVKDADYDGAVVNDARDERIVR